jgi:hypothetical protein
MKNGALALIVLSVMAAVAANRAAALEGDTVIADEAQRYSVAANSLRLDVGNQSFTKNSLHEAALRKRRWPRTDCKRAPGLCTWWEHCCEVFDPDGDTIGHICVDKKKRCPVPF